VSDVSFSPALRWLVLLLLALTLGSKLAVDLYVRSGDSGEPGEELFARRVATFLFRNHYTVTASRQVVFGMYLLQVSGGACAMKVVLSSPRGWHRDLIRTFITPGDRTFVVFGGKVYSEQPMWLTVFAFLWSKFLDQLGVKSDEATVITVIAGSDCDAERLPWSELSRADFGPARVALGP